MPSLNCPRTECSKDKFHVIYSSGAVGGRVVLRFVCSTWNFRVHLAIMNGAVWPAGLYGCVMGDDDAGEG